MRIQASDARDLVRSPDAPGYELPETGTSLLDYVVRRMHKTGLLEASGALASTERGLGDVVPDLRVNRSPSSTVSAA